MRTLKLFYFRTRRLRRLLIFLLLIILFCMFIFSVPRNYEHTYNLNNIDITEKYSKEDSIYYYTFKKGKSNYEYAIKSDYINDKELITKVIIKDNCLIAKSTIDNFTICKDNNNYVTQFYNKINKDKYSKDYENIKIYDLKGYNYLIWNYKSLLSINNTSNKKISLFDKDIYTLDLITKYNNYLVIPDYNSEYYFTKLYLINIENNDVKEVNLNKKIYFDSYFLGNYNNRLYLYDLDREKEYAINIKNGDVTKVSYQILNNGVWESTSKIKLNKKTLLFTESKQFEFVLEDNILYYETPVNKIQITNQKVDKIIETFNEDVFYLSEDTIYHANLDDGITKVMTYSEWKFNNKNIYIFKK